MAKHKPHKNGMTEGIVTSNGPGRAALTRRQWLIVGAAAALVLLVGGVVWAVTRSDKSGSTKSDSSVASDTKPTDPSPQDMKLSGDYDGATVALNEQLKSAKTPGAKADVYVQLSTVSYAAGQYQTALEQAEQADKLAPTEGSARMAAVSAEALDNKPLALAYYQKALARIPKEVRDHAPDVADGYKAKITELGG